ncbi:MAG: WecB/TagA/CpsF family glycosyltransferase [Cyanobacteria bacterium CRU_2_1]|nr:WecB/TagA/CpsF family glycosyltransferase [Cyanobacteria bacterium RU_5_0]NJR60079.1 WecB/TagA/CpsF family glycosyltransferase [Cyanobacteria bacterium CRU_2_1]
MSKVKVLNASIDNLSMSELLAKLNQGVVYTPNVDHLVKLQVDREFFDAYCAADYRTCDSKILFLASKLLGSPIREKVSGSDLFPAFYEYHRNSQNIKIFLLGAREGVAAEAQKKINSKVGREMVVGVHSPSFGFEKSEEEIDRIIDIVNQSGATVLAVGVGAPKQEKFIHKYKDRFKNIKIFMAIGATLDFEAGNVNRAPKWTSEMGLEWLYRLLSEPRRLWKRYLVEGPFFFWFVLLQMLNLYANPFSKPASEQNSDTSYNSITEVL